MGDSWRCCTAVGFGGGVDGRNGGVVTGGNKGRRESFDGDDVMVLAALALALRFIVGEGAMGGNSAIFCNKRMSPFHKRRFHNNTLGGVVVFSLPFLIDS